MTKDQKHLVDEYKEEIGDKDYNTTKDNIV